VVEKDTDPDDRRRVILTITAKARALRNALAPVQRPANDRLFHCLSARDFNKFRKIMADLVETADQAIKLLDYTSPALLAGSTRRQLRCRRWRNSGALI
jgi:hypothetical protein